MNRFKFLTTIALGAFFLIGPAFHNHIMAQKSESPRSPTSNLPTSVMAESNVDLTGCSDKRQGARYHYESQKNQHNDDNSKNVFWYRLMKQYGISDCFCDSQTRSEVDKNNSISRKKNCDETRNAVWYVYQMTIQANPKLSVSEESKFKFWNETVRKYNAQGCFCR